MAKLTYYPTADQLAELERLAVERRWSLSATVAWIVERYLQGEAGR